MAQLHVTNEDSITKSKSNKFVQLYETLAFHYNTYWFSLDIKKTYM